ncbi:unnamed protein product [Symbiodinium natans]|uniref:Fatty acid hydroxylase domain-containing protein n=1 Tax=Symbiodinium natans TaxID=878477 RepID=A0A812MUQ9_9DINO|nr:unnamed protein product [Symbiodinium natans]
MERAARYLEVNFVILRAFISGIATLSQLPHELWSSTKNGVVVVPKRLTQEYIGKIDAVAQAIRQKGPPPQAGLSTHSLLVMHRWLWIGTALVSCDMRIFVAVGLLQFLAAPYSLVCSFMLFVMHFNTMCLGHLASGLALSVVPLPSCCSVEIGSAVIGMVLLLDFAATAYYAFWACSDGLPKKLPLRETLYHMIYGTFQAKTYILLVLTMCWGYRINLAWLALDAVVGISPLVNNFMQRTVLSWESLFYHIHRMEHLPGVYEHAHRMHHYLPDGTAWDAHVHSGAGFPEEWFYLMHDIFLVRVLGLPPPFMTYRLLKYQLGNKDGHQRRMEPYKEEQYHQDHHLFHRKNFGFNRPCLDMVFDTYKPTMKKRLEVNGAIYSKEETSDSIMIHIEVVDEKLLSISSQRPAGWQQPFLKLMRFLWPLH